MTLRDHFRPPLTPHHSWESFHSNWATRIADALNDRLPPGFLAEEHTYAGGRLEIDVAAYERPTLAPHANGVAVVEPLVYAPPAPAFTAPGTFPDSFEVRVYATTGGHTLVAVVELVSPANKDRPEERRAFAAKAVGFLHQGVALAVVDVVTTRRANLHNDVVEYFSADPAHRLPDAADLYAVAYRPVVRGDRAEIDVWPHALAVGRPLPELPLRLTGDRFIALDLAGPYAEACRRRRIP